MSHSLLRVALLAVLAAATPARAAEEPALPEGLPPFGEDRPLPVPEIHESALPNGLTVWLVARPGFPRVSAVLAVRGGTAADRPGEEGLGELLAETVTQGTASRSSRQIAEELQAAGGELSASAGPDAIFLSGGGLSTSVAAVLEVLADVAQRASFPSAEVELARENALQALEARESTPEFLGVRALARVLYGDHPYGHAAPTREALSAATPEALRREFARRFRPEGSLLVVAGEFEPSAVARLAEGLFGDWRGVGEGPAATPPAPLAPGRRRFVVDRPGSVQSLLLVARPAPTVTEEDYFPALVANTICGGTFSSRFVTNVREEKGYSYSPSSSLIPRQLGGELRLRADVRNEVTGAALLEAFYELDRLATTDPTAEELSRAKRSQAGLYLLRNQLQGSVAQTLARNWVNGLPPSALAEFVPRVQAVTAEQVRAVGRRLFASATQTVVVVGDGETVRRELAPFGEVQAVPP